MSGKASHSSAEVFSVKDELHKIQNRVSQAKAMGVPAGDGGVPCPAQMQQDGILESNAMQDHIQAESYINIMDSGCIMMLHGLCSNKVLVYPSQLAKCV